MKSEKQKLKTVSIDAASLNTIQQIRDLHATGAWDFLPRQVVNVLYDTHSDFGAFSKSGDVQDIPNKAIVAMAVEFFHLYMFSANPYNRAQMRKWFGLDGRAHSLESLHETVLLGAIIQRDIRAKQLEDAMEDGDPQTDDDFVFDED